MLDGVIVQAFMLGTRFLSTSYQAGEGILGTPLPHRDTHTVLIVDDNPHLLQAVKEALTLLGPFTIITAANGMYGLRQAIEQVPDCIVIDVMMPGIDGLQLTRALRGDLTTAHIPIVILTAKVQPKNIYDGLAAGADYYLLKPVKPQDLAAAIAKAIQTNTHERERNLEALVRELPPRE